MEIVPISANLVGNIIIPEPIILTMVRMVSCTTPILLLLALIIYTPTSAVKKSDVFNRTFFVCAERVMRKILTTSLY